MHVILKVLLLLLLLLFLLPMLACSSYCYPAGLS
jgi:hypothetical protein